MGWSSGEGEDKWGTGDLRAGSLGRQDHIDLAALPDGVMRLRLLTRIGVTEPDGWLEVHKDGEFALVACSAGLGAVIRDGKVVGCRPVPQAVAGP